MPAGDLQSMRPEDAEQMKAIERALVAAALPFRAHTNPLLVAMALVRMARTMLRLANTNDQKEVLPVLQAFLRGDLRGPKDPDSVIWTPGDAVH